MFINALRVANSFLNVDNHEWIRTYLSPWEVANLVDKWEYGQWNTDSEVILLWSGGNAPKWEWVGEGGADNTPENSL